MLEYRLDDLHWWEFEKLCQALLKAELSVGVEAWGGSGDWGNDAYCRASLHYPGTALEEGPFQFQVKFVQGAHAAGAKPEKRLLRAVQQECSRIKRRDGSPARVYSLLTNVVPSPELRCKIEQTIRVALPDCAMVVVHGGDDICSWLHSHPKVVRMFPQLLSHRDLSELLRRSGETEGESVPEDAPAPPLSPELRRRIRRARQAMRRREVDAAFQLWEEVYRQAREQQNTAEEIGARLNTALLLIEEEGRLDEAVEIVDSCLRAASTEEIGSKRALLLQVIGEVHRIKGNHDLARGFLASALEQAQSSGSHLDEGFALLALSAVEHGSSGSKDVSTILELIEEAYQAFSAEYLSGDAERQERARDAFAQCHFWKAEVLGPKRPGEALGELSRALEIYEELGDNWAWDVGDTLLRRAQLLSRSREPQSAFNDLRRAAEMFGELGYHLGVAKCHLEAGELLDYIGQRNEATDHYKHACAVASSSRLDRKSSYFFFRYAVKLLELRQFSEAVEILEELLGSPWLEREAKLTVASQLSLAAKAMGDDEKARTVCEQVLDLIDETISAAGSAKERRQLLIQKGHQLAELGRHGDALRCYKDTLAQLEANGDQPGVVECWFHIRGVMQQLNDAEGEREAARNVLDLGGERINPMFAALALVTLAQLNIQEQRYSEASLELERAKELAPDNPAVDLVASDLKGKLPQFLPSDSPERGDSITTPRRTLHDLVQELHEWCATFPEKRKSILAVWYHIHRVELWSIFRSMLGVKFLVCSTSLKDFERVRRSLLRQSDLLVWGTSLPLRASKLRNIRGLDQVPVPRDFLFPAGVTLVTPKDLGGESDATGTAAPGHSLLGRSESLPDRAYYLAFMRDDKSEVRPFFFGRRQVWLKRGVVDFMLKQPSNGGRGPLNICLPLTEGRAVPKLGRIMQVASDARAIPVFSRSVPTDEGVVSDWDVVVNLPSSGSHQDALRELWLDLVLSCAENPQYALRRFAREIKAIAPVSTESQVVVRVYLLRFGEGQMETVHPAVVA